MPRAVAGPSIRNLDERFEDNFWTWQLQLIACMSAVHCFESAKPQREVSRKFERRASAMQVPCASAMRYRQNGGLQFTTALHGAFRQPSESGRARSRDCKVQMIGFARSPGCGRGKEPCNLRLCAASYLKSLFLLWPSLLCKICIM